MRNFDKTRRIVVKVGTNILSRRGKVDTDFLRVIARQIAELIKQDRQVILVSSGAIGMGYGALKLKKPPREVVMRQVCAAVGQGILMREYQEAFAEFSQTVAQVLLTNRIMSQRHNYVNLKNTMETLLAMKVVPIVNENDCVSIDEIDLAFGDNDRLSALVASKIDADLLILLSDVKGLYNQPPRKSRQATLIHVVPEITAEIEAMAGQSGSEMGTGGMKSKLAAIRIAARGGCRAVLAHGREDNVILRIIAGEDIGTLFLPKRRLSNRKRWIWNSLSKGSIEVDPGAATAILNRRSLLAVGITQVRGNFRPGDVVDINHIAKGITKVSANELRNFLREKQAGQPHQHNKHRAVIHVDDIVLTS